MPHGAIALANPAVFTPAFRQGTNWAVEQNKQKVPTCTQQRANTAD